MPEVSAWIIVRTLSGDFESTVPKCKIITQYCVFSSDSGVTALEMSSYADQDIGQYTSL